MRAAEESKRVVREATEASITAARDTVVASARILEEAIKKAEETTRTARKAARASMRVFEEAAAGAEKFSQEVEEQPSELPSSKLFEEALSRIEPDESRLKPAPHEAKRDMRARLEFLAKMYASEKDKPFEKSDDSQEDER
jgi:hypothetical protein